MCPGVWTNSSVESPQVESLAVGHGPADCHLGQRLLDILLLRRAGDDLAAGGFVQPACTADVVRVAVGQDDGGNFGLAQGFPQIQIGADFVILAVGGVNECSPVGSHHQIHVGGIDTVEGPLANCDHVYIVGYLHRDISASKASLRPIVSIA